MIEWLELTRVELGESRSERWEKRFSAVSATRNRPTLLLLEVVYTKAVRCFSRIGSNSLHACQKQFVS
jgi:hypothetical protein